MTPTERHILAAFIRACSSEALREVVETPMEGWRINRALDVEGRRCLIGVAAGTGWNRRRVQVSRRPLPPSADVPGAFDTCCVRDGLRSTVEVVQEMARRVLGSRGAKGVL